MKPQTSSPTSDVTPIKRNSPGVKTIWPINHTCGHQVDRDLSDRSADRRAGFAEWLAKQKCTDCWHTAKEGEEQDKTAWLQAKRAEEQAESEAWSEQYRMPPLDGTERAVAWGVRCRHQILTAAYTDLVTERETSEAEWEEIGESARTITRAGWWIDQRASRPDDLTELLQPPSGPTSRPRTPTSDWPGAPLRRGPGLLPLLTRWTLSGLWPLPGISGRAKSRIRRILSLPARPSGSSVEPLRGRHRDRPSAARQ
ncbi:hypothetical protein AB0N99_36455 [Streptomyces sp. NPDC093272]|uniref:hypothetical protein n=1 Tax=unclassified Streptomyces TaxID=2593676 RepID=UPI00343C8411